MHYERNTSAVVEFYKNERLPQLDAQIKAAFRPKNGPINLELVEPLINEYNEALELVHGKDAPYIPHYRIEAQNETPLLRQFMPAFTEGKKKTNDPDRFSDGPAAGLIIPKVTKEAGFENQPDFDISFLTEPLKHLSIDVQEETYQPESIPTEGPYEIVLYQSQDLDESDLDDLEVQYGSRGAQTQNYDGDDDFDDEEYEESLGSIREVFPEVELFFDEDVESGMLLLELYDPINEQVDALYVPHIPMNFPIIMSLMSDYIEIGGGVSLTFSLKDRDDNLIIPIDPTDPDSDTPINPSLN